MLLIDTATTEFVDRERQGSWLDFEPHEPLHTAAILEAPGGNLESPIVAIIRFERLEWTRPDNASILLDRFPGAPGVVCCFLRLPPGIE